MLKFWPHIISELGGVFTVGFSKLGINPLNVNKLNFKNVLTCSSSYCCRTCSCCCCCRTISWCRSIPSFARDWQQSCREIIQWGSVIQNTGIVAISIKIWTKNSKTYAKLVTLTKNSTKYSSVWVIKPYCGIFLWNINLILPFFSNCTISIFYSSYLTLSWEGKFNRIVMYTTSFSPIIVSIKLK